MCIRNTNFKLSMVNKIKDFIPMNTALIMYKTMILPYLEFGNVFLLNCTEGDLMKIQRTQNRCLKILMKRDSLYETELLHWDARLATWWLRALTSAMQLMFKYKFDCSLLAIRTDENVVSTRSQRGPVFHTVFPRSERFAKSTAYLLYTEWNTLPLTIRMINDYEHFKLVIKRYYKGNYHPSVT